MELKSLIIGILFSMGIFAVKSGLGMAYYLKREERKRRRLAFAAAFLLIYSSLFGGAGILLGRVDLSRHYMAFKGFLESGMLVHFIMAFLMSLWGVRLLRLKSSGRPASRAWLLLVIPCPVCVMVILFNVAFLMALFPESGMIPVVWICAGFLCVSLAVGFGLALLDIRRKVTPEALLGTGMLVVAAYFCLAVLIMPHFSDLDNIYRLALYNEKGGPVPAGTWRIFFSGVIGTSVAGFSAAFYRIRKMEY